MVDGPVLTEVKDEQEITIVDLFDLVESIADPSRVVDIDNNEEEDDLDSDYGHDVNDVDVNIDDENYDKDYDEHDYDEEDHDEDKYLVNVKLFWRTAALSTKGLVKNISKI